MLHAHCAPRAQHTQQCVACRAPQHRVHNVHGNTLVPLGIIGAHSLSIQCSGDICIARLLVHKKLDPCSHRTALLVAHLRQIIFTESAPRISWVKSSQHNRDDELALLARCIQLDLTRSRPQIPEIKKHRNNTARLDPVAHRTLRVQLHPLQIKPAHQRRHVLCCSALFDLCLDCLHKLLRGERHRRIRIPGTPAVRQKHIRPQDALQGHNVALAARHTAHLALTAPHLDCVVAVKHVRIHIAGIDAHWTRNFKPSHIQRTPCMVGRPSESNARCLGQCALQRVADTPPFLFCLVLRVLVLAIEKRGEHRLDMPQLIHCWWRGLGFFEPSGAQLSILRGGHARSQRLELGLGNAPWKHRKRMASRQNRGRSTQRRLLFSLMRSRRLAK
eukprot:comp22438_c0_seq1/m.55030 comp22438_c0_seq1/g.55030  ORF comp22438_c0_seq1/g.55030 comp22438_c0_seq1/m.55030 type:complete len:388 (-) comp22438_c0_seq1:703-1866(-)